VNKVLVFYVSRGLSPWCGFGILFFCVLKFQNIQEKQACVLCVFEFGFLWFPTLIKQKNFNLIDGATLYLFCNWH